MKFKNLQLVIFGQKFQFYCQIRKSCDTNIYILIKLIKNDSFFQRLWVFDVFFNITVSLFWEQKVENILNLLILQIL